MVFVPVVLQVYVTTAESCPCDGTGDQVKEIGSVAVVGVNTAVKV